MHTRTPPHAHTKRQIRWGGIFLVQVPVRSRVRTALFGRVSASRHRSQCLKVHRRDNVQCLSVQLKIFSSNGIPDRKGHSEQG